MAGDMRNEEHEPVEQLDEPLELPRPGGAGALEAIEDIKRTPAGFSCLGLGCMPWLAMLATGALLWSILR